MNLSDLHLRLSVTGERTPANLLLVYAKDVRNGDVLIEQSDAVIDHVEFDNDPVNEAMVLLVPRGSDHDGYWYLTKAVMMIDRPRVHQFD